MCILANEIMKRLLRCEIQIPFKEKNLVQFREIKTSVI